MTVQSLDRSVELQRETCISKPNVHCLLKALKSHALVDPLAETGAAH